jgi:O-antigen biosynthesis protein
LKRIYKSTVTSYLNSHIGEITPLLARKSEQSGLRLNLLVPSINQEHLFGGISTALHFFQLFANKGFKLRLILTDASPSEMDLAKFIEYHYVNSQDDHEASLQIVAFNDRYNKTIPVGKDDVFMATAWWTAYAAQRLVVWQEKAYNQETRKMLYFIQDFEPGFYPWSSQYVLADSTYKFEGQQIAVFNSSLLRDFFLEQGYKFSKQYAFEPKLNLKLQGFLQNGKSIEKRKRILIYGRPSVARNAFTLIIEALRTWIWQQPNVNDWEIISAGEQHLDIELGNGVKVISYGKMTLEDYADMLKQSAIGISLMVSPHPSYPPLEMAHFGMLVLTNHYANKDLSSWHDNITSLENYSPDVLASKLGELCLSFELNSKIGFIGKSHVPFYIDSSTPFYFIDEIAELLKNK